MHAGLERNILESRHEFARAIEEPKISFINTQPAHIRSEVAFGGRRSNWSEGGLPFEQRGGRRGSDGRLIRRRSRGLCHHGGRRVLFLVPAFRFFFGRSR